MTTMKELREFIESKNKAPGTYTEDEIYEIGVMHKSLDKSVKNWNSLAEVLGVGKSGEAFRSWVNHRQLKDGTLPKNENMLSDRTLDGVGGQEIDDKINLLRKQQQKTRDEWTALRRLNRDESRIDSFKEAIVSTVDKLNALPQVTSTKQSRVNYKKEAILLLSDLHIGVECDNFYNTYNVDIARKRIQKVVDDTIRYCKEQNPARLTILNLGDLVHGIIHVNARIEASLDVVDEIMVASEIISQALNQLQGVAPEVIYRSCVDNHSRAVADKNQAIEKENFNKLIDWYLQERLKNTKIKFVNDNISDEIGKFNLLNGKVVMFAHGHNDNINSSFDHFIGATREFVDYIMLGHYHSSKAKTYNGITVICNGSVVGTEQFAMSKRLFGNPSQTLLMFDDDNLVNYTINLSINK